MKYVLVTGANGGMGKATVEALRESGYGVFALDKTLCDEKENVYPVEVDLTDDESVALAFKKVRSVTDELYAIIHFAGIYTLNSLIEIDNDAFYKAFDVNVFGAFRINKAFFSLLKNGSRIVHTTSELAPLDPLPFTGLYAITKSALDKYAYSLRMELQLKGVTVVTLRPGAVSTDMLGVSTSALDRFCENTSIYNCNAKRFKSIVERVEARNVPPQKISKRIIKILRVKKPRHVYSVNRNPLLLLLNLLPSCMQTWIIKKVLNG